MRARQVFSYLVFFGFFSRKGILKNVFSISCPSVRPFVRAEANSATIGRFWLMFINVCTRSLVVHIFVMCDHCVVSKCLYRDVLEILIFGH